MTMSSDHGQEIAEGRRFEFGSNWTRFLEVLDDERIVEAERSLAAMLGRERFDGLRFLDAGSGSGLFSLAARRLGATVVSFDFDPESVACTSELRRRHDSNDAGWKVHTGSVLDRPFLSSLGQFDIVYSWGVLHHTGAMWDAIANVCDVVAPRGLLFIAIYNDQGRRSRAWLKVKEAYCGSSVGKAAVLSTFVPYFVGRAALADLARGENPFTRYQRYKSRRGMSMMHDIVDWLGGLPFEVATPEAVLDAVKAKGFSLERMRTAGAYHGCNEFVFERR
jgi:2-polyprenyl-3-methyl-5-hydroxy-6-metoxy-1,4-benzoquinol methylase